MPYPNHTGEHITFLGVSNFDKAVTNIQSNYLFHSISSVSFQRWVIHSSLTRSAVRVFIPVFVPTDPLRDPTEFSLPCRDHDSFAWTPVARLLPAATYQRADEKAKPPRVGHDWSVHVRRYCLRLSTPGKHSEAKCARPPSSPSSERVQASGQFDYNRNRFGVTLGNGTVRGPV